MKCIELIPGPCPKCNVPITATLPRTYVQCYQCNKCVKVLNNKKKEV
jgi:hypothetical protein